MLCHRPVGASIIQCYQRQKTDQRAHAGRMIRYERKGALRFHKLRKGRVRISSTKQYKKWVLAALCQMDAIVSFTLYLAMSLSPTVPFTALSLAISIYVLLRIFQWRRVRVLMPPGPPGIPFLGNALQVPKERAFIQFLEWGKTYGRTSIAFYCPICAHTITRYRSYNIFRYGRKAISSREFAERRERSL